MSAEREVFKQMGRLAEQRKLFLSVVDDSARRLMRVAIREFVLEHPEVQSLNWNQSAQDNEIRMISSFNITIDGQAWWASHLKDRNPQLSKCLEVLNDNCHSFPEALIAEFGIGKVSITQEIAKTIGV